MYRKPGRGRVLLLMFLALSIIVITIDYRAGSGGILTNGKRVVSCRCRSDPAWLHHSRPAGG